MPKTRWLLVVLGVAVVALPWPAARASTGAGVGANPIVLAHPARPGRTYSLPGLYVINTGTDASTYRLAVQALPGGQGRAIPSTWVSFGRNDIALIAKQSTIVPMSLAVPSHATAGKYLSYVVVGATTSSQAGQTALGAAAATELRLSVASSDSRPVDLSALWRSPWRYLFLGAGALVGLMALARLGRLRLRFERR